MLSIVITIKRSRSRVIIRLATTAGVRQPKPKERGMTASPDIPTKLPTRAKATEYLGSRPLSSRSAIIIETISIAGITIVNGIIKPSGTARLSILDNRPGGSKDLIDSAI